MSTWATLCRTVLFVTSISLYHRVAYRISSKSRHTSKSQRPRNLAACFCILIPINVALEISPHGKGSLAIYVCAYALYVHTNRLIIEGVYMRVHQTEPWNKSRRSEISRKYNIIISYSEKLLSNLDHFMDLIFMEICDHARYSLYSCANFVGLNFIVCQIYVKNARIKPLKSFPLWP